MDKQNTPTGSKRSRSRVSNLSTSQMPTGAYHLQMPSPTGAYHPQILESPNFVYANMSPPPYAQSSNFVSNPQVSFTSLLSQTPILPYVPLPQQPTAQHPTAHEPRDTQQQSSSDEYADVIPETQPSPPPPPQPQPTRKSRKGKKPTEGRSKCNPWKADEEVELSKAWAETSEDPNIGNYRNGDAFWKTVKASFDTRMGFDPDYRSVDAIMSKVKTLLSSVAKFGCIYNNVVNSKKSGENDTDVLQRARFRYREEVHKTFPHEHAWNILKESPKFHPVDILGPSNVHAPKRSKTSETASPASSDARTYFNVDNDEEAEEENERPRPMGRNAARRAASSSTSAASQESVTALLEQLNTYNASNHSYLDTMRRNAEVREARQKSTDLAFYIQPHDHLTGGALTTVLRAKEELRQKYGWDPL